MLLSKMPAILAQPRRANQLALRSPGDLMKHRAAQGNWKASRSCPGRGAAFVTLLRTAGTHVELSALCNLSLYSKMADHDPPYRPASGPPYEFQVSGRRDRGRGRARYLHLAARLGSGL